MISDFVTYPGVIERRSGQVVGLCGSLSEGRALIHAQAMRHSAAGRRARMVDAENPALPGSRSARVVSEGRLRKMTWCRSQGSQIIQGPQHLGACEEDHRPSPIRARIPARVTSTYSYWPKQVRSQNGTSHMAHLSCSTCPCVCAQHHQGTYCRTALVGGPPAHGDPLQGGPRSAA